ncbi:MAG: MFS transporter [Formivibrio sp.]|nr:MFS transporter [Formivibrio sp.]
MSGVCLVLLGCGVPLWLFVPLLLIGGLADGAFRPVNQRLVLEPCLVEQRPLAQGLLRVAFNLGVAVAGVTGGLLASLGYQWVYVADGAASLLAAAWVTWAYRRFPVAWVRNIQARSGSTATLNGPWQDSVFLRLMLGMALAIAVFDQMFVTFGLFLREQDGLGPEWIGYMFTLNGLMIVVLQIPVSRRVLDWGLMRCAHLGVLLTGAGFVWLNAGTGVLWAVLAMITLTFGELLISPTFSQLIMIRSEGRQRGRYMGIYTAAWSGRALYAPALGTWLYGALGGARLWWVCLVVVCVSIMIQHDALRRIIKDV